MIASPERGFRPEVERGDSTETDFRVGVARPAMLLAISRRPRTLKRSMNAAAGDRDAHQPTDALWLLVRDPSVRATPADYLLVPSETHSHSSPDGVFTPAAYTFKIATRPDDPRDPVVIAH